MPERSSAQRRSPHVPQWTGGVISCVFTAIIILSFWDPAYYKAIGDQTGYMPVQPVAYSHKQHAGDFSIPCLFCHTAAPQSRVAGIPDAAICMKCHSQVTNDSPEIQKVVGAIESGTSIEWIRVTNLPDFVYFNHSRHIAREIECQHCHGPVETMDRVYEQTRMTMGWCVDCHREYMVNPPPETGPVEASVECSVCHY